MAINNNNYTNNNNNNDDDDDDDHNDKWVYLQLKNKAKLISF
jgi:hypothetical protein